MSDRTYTFSKEGRRLTTHWGGESIKLNMAEQWEGEHGYAPKNHDHDSKYAKLGHTHDGIGDLPAHNHDTVYSKLGHAHDDKYSKLGHVHDYASKDHNHDDRYSLLSHSHELLDMLPIGTVLWFKSNVTLSNKWTVYTDLIGRYPLGATSNLGGTVEAGLPQIPAHKHSVSQQSPSAATAGAGMSAAIPGATTTISTTGMTITDKDTVFGKSDTVTPPSVNLIPYIKIA